MADKTRKVIGIDPASGEKGSHVMPGILTTQRHSVSLPPRRTSSACATIEVHLRHQDQGARNTLSVRRHRLSGGGHSAPDQQDHVWRTHCWYR